VFFKKTSIELRNTDNIRCKWAAVEKFKQGQKEAKIQKNREKLISCKIIGYA